MEGKTWVRNWEEPQPKTGGEVAPDFDSRFGRGIEATGNTTKTDVVQQKINSQYTAANCKMMEINILSA